MMWAATVGKNAFLANWAIAWKSMATPDRSIDARFSLLGLISNWNGNHFSLAAVLTVTPTFLCLVMATNLSSVFYVSKPISGAMVERGSGKIVNIGSVQSLLARQTIAPYSASNWLVTTWNS